MTRTSNRSQNADEITRSITVRIPQSLKDALDSEAHRRGTTFTQVVLDRLALTPSNPSSSALTGPGKMRGTAEDPAWHKENCRTKVVTGRGFCLDHQVFLS